MGAALIAGTRARRTAWLACTAALLAAVTGLAGCGESAPEVSSKEINLLIWREYVPPQMIEGFEDRYDVKANVTYFESNEDMIAKVKARPGRYDIVIPSDYAVESMIGDGLLEPIDLQKVPNFDNVEQRFRRPAFDPGSLNSQSPGRRREKYSVPYAWGTTGLVYNAAKVSPPVRRWEDLFRPSLRGRIVVVDDARSVIGATLLTLGKSFNADSEADIDAAQRKLETISGTWIINNGVPEDDLISGRALIGLMYNGNGFLAQRRSPNLKYVLPAEGPNIYFDNLAIPKGAPHRDAALAFINLALEPQYSKLITTEFGYSSVNTKAIEDLRRSDPAVIDSPIVSPPLDALDNAVLVRDLGARGNARFVRAWEQLTGRKVTEPIRTPGEATP